VVAYATGAFLSTPRKVRETLVSFDVTGDADSFAARCIQLHSGEQLWTRLRYAGFEWIERECSPQLFEGQMRQALSTSRRGGGRRATPAGV
jgi:hypothetical protein